MTVRWRVLPGGTSEREDLTAGGQFIKMMDVKFELLDSGTVGTVTLQRRDFSADTVARLITEYAEHLSATENLSSE
jgi:hypothetical protein